MQAASHRSRFLPLMAALTATAWLALWLWGQSPYGRWLDHGSWAEIGVAGSLCRALPGGRDALTGSLVVGGWVLMLSAMMLPTTCRCSRYSGV
jgi:predicted metal-binding membrane protein